MIEGWHGSDHLILFDEAEIAAASDRYAVSQFLPGYEVIGLRWWDDFILQDFGGATFCAPTIQAVAELQITFRLMRSPQKERHSNSMIVFRAKSSGTSNLSCSGATRSRRRNHLGQSRSACTTGQMVKYWNGLYRSLKSR